MTGHVLVVDQGTTSTRSIIFGPDAALVAMAQEEFPQIFPQPGWVEHDPESLWRTTPRQRGRLCPGPASTQARLPGSG
jgi:glycerol kinase